MTHLTKSQIKWVRSLQQKKNRDAEGVFVAEGEKCVTELRNAFEMVLLATPDNATAIEIAQMSNLRTPQGMIGVFRKREAINNGKRAIGNGIVVALDGVRIQDNDPESAIDLDHDILPDPVADYEEKLAKHMEEINKRLKELESSIYTNCCQAKDKD